MAVCTRQEVQRVGSIASDTSSTEEALFKRSIINREVKTLPKSTTEDMVRHGESGPVRVRDCGKPGGGT